MRVNVLADAKRDLNHVVSAQHRARRKGAWSSKTSKEKNRGTTAGKQTTSTTRQPSPTKPPTEKKHPHPTTPHCRIAPAHRATRTTAGLCHAQIAFVSHKLVQLLACLLGCAPRMREKNAKTSSRRQRFTTTSATPYNHSLPVRRDPQRN